jgi:hypothetical protein
MARYDEEFAPYLETIRHGGLEAVFLFVDLARTFYENGEEERVSNWVGIAVAAIPDADRPAAITQLLRALPRKDKRAHLHLVHPTLQ